jgi:hypothetical protein
MKQPRSKKEAIAALYNRGALFWKLHAGQKGIYDQFKTSKGLKFVLNCSRRYGKSFLLCLIAVEHAIANPNSQIRYAAPTQKAVRKIIQPIIRQILEDCPRALYPKWNSQEGCYTFKNGSQIHVAGTNKGHVENLRGMATHLGIVDEAGFVECEGGLEYLVSDILMPQTLTCGGRLILASTPPRTPGHDFANKYCFEAEATGNYAKRTIYQNPTLTPELIAEYQKEAGGEHTSTWKREYLCEFVTDEEAAVIPEFTEALASSIVKETERPPYFDAYVGMDVGFKDLTFAVFGYYDFTSSKLVIEEELVINKMTTPELAAEIKAREERLWSKKAPYLRVSDIDLILLHDLNKLHNLNFIATAKDNKEAAVNQLRIMLRNEQIVIHPRCRNLIAHLKFATWNKQRTSFERSGDYGHFDGVDALVYLVRNIRKNKNPYPSHHGLDSFNQVFPAESSQSKTASSIKRLFKPRLVS